MAHHDDNFKRTGRGCLTEIEHSGMVVRPIRFAEGAHAALDLAKRAYVLENGKVVLEGADLAGDSRVQEAYLGGVV